MPKGRKPTVKQSRFVDEYLKNGGNARKAARDAGYSESTVQLATRDVLSKPLVKDTIAKKQAEIDKRNGTDIISLAEIQKI
jgi:phage terminase small subunit